MNSKESPNPTLYEISQEDLRKRILDIANKEGKLYEEDMFLVFDSNNELNHKNLMICAESFLETNGFMFSDHLRPVKDDKSGQRYLSVRRKKRPT